MVRRNMRNLGFVILFLLAFRLPAADAAAKKFVEERGAGELAKISKLHFRTALRAQGLPEPPKTEWRR